MFNNTGQTKATQNKWYKHCRGVASCHNRWNRLLSWLHWNCVVDGLVISEAQVICESSKGLPIGHAHLAVQNFRSLMYTSNLRPDCNWWQCILGDRFWKFDAVETSELMKSKEVQLLTSYAEGKKEPPNLLIVGTVMVFSFLKFWSIVLLTKCPLKGAHWYLYIIILYNSEYSCIYSLVSFQQVTLYGSWQSSKASFSQTAKSIWRTFTV